MIGPMEAEAGSKATKEIAVEIFPGIRLMHLGSSEVLYLRVLLA